MLMTHAPETGASFLAPVSGAGFWSVCQGYYVTEAEAVVEQRADRSFDGQVGLKVRSDAATSVLGDFGPLSFRSLKRDRNDRGPN